MEKKRINFEVLVNLVKQQLLKETNMNFKIRVSKKNQNINITGIQ